jgi:hypothetical protein
MMFKKKECSFVKLEFGQAVRSNEVLNAEARVEIQRRS